MLLFFLPVFVRWFSSFRASGRATAPGVPSRRGVGHAQRAGTPQYTEFHAQTDGSATHPFAARERREPSPPRSAPAGRCRTRSPRACAAAQPLFTPNNIAPPVCSQLVVWGNNHSTLSTLCTAVPELAAVNIFCVLQRDIAAALPAFGSSTGDIPSENAARVPSVTAGPHCKPEAGVKPCDGLMWGPVGRLTWAWNNGDAPYVYWFLRHAASLASEYVWMMEYGKPAPCCRLPNSHLLASA
jgi:hypothetical protein